MFSEMSAACWWLIAMEVLGLGSAWATRLHLGTPHEARSHRFFLVCLGMVSVASLVALRIGPVSWLTSSITIAGMILMVTCDFRRLRPETIW